LSLNVQRTMISRRYREVFPHIMVGVPNWIMNTSMTEFAKFKGSLRTTTINGPITGLELNLGILDDFVKGRAEANSTLARRGWIRSYGMVWPRGASHASSNCSQTQIASGCTISRLNLAKRSRSCTTSLNSRFSGPIEQPFLAASGS
jgi:hypothetical protein